jgi:membrane associated rhomboid family serine protease
LTDTNEAPSFGRALAIKFRRVFLPLLLAVVALLGVYSALNWLLLAGSAAPFLDKDVANYWLPGVLACVLAFVFVWPGIKLLRLSEKRSLPLIYSLLAAAAIAGPALLAQNYVSRAAGDVTDLAEAAQIATAPPAKFYTVHHLCFALVGTRGQPVVSLSGRHDERMDFDFYVTVPVCNGNAMSKTVWIGLTFHKQIDNSLPDAAKDAAFHAFGQEVQAAINATDPAQYRFLVRAAPSQDRRNFEKALQNGHIDTTGVVFLEPHTEAFADRAGRSLPYAFEGLLAAIVIWFLLVMPIPLKDPEDLAPPKPSLKTWEPTGEAAEAPDTDAGSLARLFVPTRENYGLALLLDINIGVYLAMVIAGLGVVSFQTDDLMNWGANYGPALHGLGLLRLISCQFVHAGIMHLAGNMYGLLIIGMFLIPVITNARLIACYLICGLGGSIASATMHPDIVGVGASGAIFGLAGILLVLLGLNDWRVAAIRRGALINIGIFVVYNLAIGAATPGIDNAAHVGGLATGAVVGLVLFAMGRRSAPPA